jgi:hypothetical protein
MLMSSPASISLMSSSVRAVDVEGRVVQVGRVELLLYRREMLVVIVRVRAVRRMHRVPDRVQAEREVLLDKGRVSTG